MNKNSLYFTFKTIALAAVLSQDIMVDTLDGTQLMGILFFGCLFTADFLISRLCRVKRARMVCAPLGIAGCFFCGVEIYFPVLLLLLFELIDLLDAGEYFYGISAASAVLALLIFEPKQFALVTAVILTAAGCFARMAVERVEYFRELSEEQRTVISEQQGRINKLWEYSQAVRETTALEERSRFSARIHDKLGHGISGSIILLEGVKLNLQKDPRQAEKSLETAVENLRSSVDEIRAALREERPPRSSASTAEMREMLDRFAVDYQIKTDFSVEGDTEKILPPVWNCIRENLTEALTNTVKHSNAGAFVLRICVYDKIIRVEFSDNGTNPDGFSKGMGIDAIEDRTGLCGGKCLFQCDVAGFKIINIFEVEI